MAGPAEPPAWLVWLSTPVVLLEAHVLYVLLLIQDTSCRQHTVCSCLQDPYSCTCFVVEVVAVVLTLRALRNRRHRTWPYALLLPPIVAFAIVDASRAYATYTPLVSVGYRSGGMPRDVPVHVSSTTLIKPLDTGPFYIRNFNALWARDPARRHWISVARASRRASEYCQPYFRHWNTLPEPAPVILPAPVQAAAAPVALPPPERQDAMIAGSPRRLVRGLEIATSADGRRQHLVDLAYRRLPLPSNLTLACDDTGEARHFIAHGRAYLYTYGRRCTDGARLLPRSDASARAALYRRSEYKNVVIELDAAAGTLAEHAVPLTFEPSEQPERGSLRAKNFVLFEASTAYAPAGTGAAWAFAITLISPHRVYRLDLGSGAMHHVATTHAPLPFKDAVGLSGGPIRLDDGRLLVAGHIRRGGWDHATRMSFFYACGAAPPFAIEAVTPLVSFGWSRNLEYLTAMQRDGDKLRVSLGVADCGSVLLELPLQSIVSLLRPISPTRRGRRRDARKQFLEARPSRSERALYTNGSTHPRSATRMNQRERAVGHETSGERALRRERPTRRPRPSRE